MPVVTQYLVERNGIQKMTFTSKTEADAYDKHLETAEALYALLESSQLITDETQRDALSLYLAEHKDHILEVLGSKRKTASKSSQKSKQSEKPTHQLDFSDTTTTMVKQATNHGVSPKNDLQDLVIEPDDSMSYSEDDIETLESFTEETEERLDTDAA